MYFFRKIMKYLRFNTDCWFYLTSLSVCSGDKKKSSEKVIFRAFFFRP